MMINLLISCNLKYLEHYKVMLYSLCRKTSENVTVYFLNSSLTQKECDSLKSFLTDKCHAELVICNVGNLAFRDFPISTLSVEAYSRILAPYYIPKDLDRILWLDGDIVIKADISAFYHQEFNDKCCIVCPDLWCETGVIQEIKVKMDIGADATYFNSGVMLMNLKKIRKYRSAFEVQKICNKYKDKLLFLDQDLLNHLYQGEVKYADWRKFNCQRVGRPKVTKVNYKDVVILHYTGIRKPWDYKFLDHLSKYYWQEYFLCYHDLNAFLETLIYYIKGIPFSAVEKLLKKFARPLHDRIKTYIMR